MATDPGYNDPFAPLDGSRTFIKPSPGGWGTGRTQAPMPPPEVPEPPLPPHGLNPLLAAANPLLMAVPRLRHTQRTPDVAALRASLVQGVRDFETNANAAGIAPERVMAARYVLCTMIDEAAADTPWGGQGAWARHSLLAEFHNEVSGGEKVFKLMARLAEKPDVNRDLLELIYAAVSLGFEGRYRVINGGHAQLEAVRAKLAQIIRQQRGAYPPVLAEHWAGSPAPTRRALSWLPLLAVTALVLLALTGLYAALSHSLSERNEPVYAQIQQLRLSPPVVAVAQLTTQPRLAQFLVADIKADLVTVRDEVDRSVVILKGEGWFPPGSATLASEREALLKRIAQALVSVGGPVLVTGHTDNQAIRTVRFPSNWHLSDERARAVRDLMVAAGLPADRVRAEGRADGEPVAPNDTPSNRALNRRVEILLMAPRTDAVARSTAVSASAAAPTPAASR